MFCVNVRKPFSRTPSRACLWDLSSQGPLTGFNRSVVGKDRISMTATDQLFPTRDYFIPRRRLAESGDNFGCHSWGTELASGGWRPGMLLNILQGSGHPPQRPVVQPKMSMTPRLRSRDRQIRTLPLRAEERVIFQSLRGCVGIVETTKRAHPRRPCAPDEAVLSAAQKGVLELWL